MRMRFSPPCRPPWWPDNEPWPHRGPATIGRLRFFRRFAAAAALLLACALFAILTLTWLAVTSAAAAVPLGARVAPLLIAIAILVAIGSMATLAAALRSVGAPLGEVMEAADRVAAGDYGVRVGERGPRPMRALARAFNTMTERLQNHDRQRRDLMADIAHELRTPLTVIQGRLEGLLDGVYARDDAQVSQLLEETHILARLVEDLRTLALAESGTLKLQREATDMAALANDVAGAFAGDAASKNVRLDVDAPADLAPIDVDPVRIREVIGNLVSNALRHTPAGGKVMLRVARGDGRPSPAGDGATPGVVVEVRDTGQGMTGEELARAFDRFYKGTRSRGSGLGLTIARNLVAAHGGEIHASSAPGRGTAIVFSLPKAV